MIFGWWLLGFRLLFYFRLHLTNLSYSPHFTLMDFHTLTFYLIAIDDLMGPSSFVIHRPYDIDTISILDISMILHQYLSLPNTNALSPHFCANGLIAHHYLSPRFVISPIYVHLSLPVRILDILRFSCLLRTRFYFISGWKSTTRYIDMYLLSPSAEHFCAHESTDVAEDGVDLCLKG